MAELYLQERGVLAEAQAKLVSFRSISHNYDAELVRRWVMPRNELRVTCMTFLDNYTSADNVDAVEAGTPRLYVDNPQIDSGRVFPGRWRLAFNHETVEETDPNKQGIFQTLRQGYITSLAADPAEWDEVRLVNDRNQQQVGNTDGDNERYITCVLPNVDPAYLQTIAAGLGGATFTNPVIKGVPYTGVFHNLIVSTATNEEDGSGIITIVMADPEYRLTSFANHLTSHRREVVYLYNVPKDQAQGIIDTWKTATITGGGVTVGYNKSQSLVDLVLHQREADASVSKLNVVTLRNCRFIEYTSYYWGLTEAEADAITITEPPAGETRQLDLSYNESEGTWSLGMVRRVRQQQTRTDVTEQSSAVEVSTTQDLGTTTAPTALTNTVGHVKRRRVGVNEDCSFDVETVDASAQNQTAQSHKIAPGRTAVTDLATQAASAVAAPAAEVGKLKQVVNRPTEFGTYHTEEEVVTVVDQTATDRVLSSARTATTAVHTSSEDEAAPAEGETATPGCIKRYSNQPTEQGTYATREEVITIVDQTSADYVRSLSQEMDAESHTSKAEAIAAVAAAQGTIVRTTNRPTEQGTFATRVETITPRNQTRTSTERLTARSADTVLNTEATDPVSAPAIEVGHIKRVSNTPTEAGNTRTEEVDITLTNQTVNFASEHLASRTAATEINTQAAAKADASGGGNGVIVRAQSQPTEVGKYQTRVDTITVVDQTTTNKTARADQTAESDIHTEGSEIDVSAISPAAGTFVKVSQRPTEAGKFATEQETVTVTNQDVIHYNKSHAEISEKSINTAAAAKAVPSTPLVAGTIERVVNEALPFADRWRTSEEIITVIDQEGEQHQVSEVQSIAMETHTAADAALGVPALPAGDDPGQIIMYQSSPTEYGKWNTVAQTRTGIYKSYTNSYDTRYGTAYISVGVNATEVELAAAIAAMSFDSSTNNGSSVSINQYGLYNYSLSKSPVRDTGLDTWTVRVSLQKLDPFYTVQNYNTSTHKFIRFQWIKYMQAFRSQADANEFAYSSAIGALPAGVADFKKYHGSVVSLGHDYWLATVLKYVGQAEVSNLETE